MIAELTNTTTVMHARLVENLTPFNGALQAPDVASTLDMATEAGKALLDIIVTKQATIIAYANDYKLLLLLALAAMPLVLFVGSSARCDRKARARFTRWIEAQRRLTAVSARTPRAISANARQGRALQRIPLFSRREAPDKTQAPTASRP